MKKLFPILFLALPLSAFADESFGGIGVTIVPWQGGARIIEVIPNTPAEESGLLPQDKIYAADGISFSGKSFDEAKDLLRGTPGKPVEVSFIRGRDSLSTTLRRSALSVKEVPMENVRAWFGDAQDSYSKEELETVAAHKAANNETLIEVLQSGYALNKGSKVQADHLTAVFVTKEAQSKSFEKKSETKKTNLRGSAMLQNFTRNAISFSVKESGKVRITVADANGQVYLEQTLSALPGANSISWSGASIPSGRYSLRIEQGSSVSNYFATLK